MASSTLRYAWRALLLAQRLRYVATTAGIAMMLRTRASAPFASVSARDAGVILLMPVMARYALMMRHYAQLRQLRYAR